jgi:hypothetical protein
MVTVLQCRSPSISDDCMVLRPRNMERKSPHSENLGRACGVQAPLEKKKAAVATIVVEPMGNAFKIIRILDVTPTE